jgi:hypothetical protein
MRVAYSVIAFGFFVASAVLGLFFLGSAALAAGSAAMLVAWSVWSVGSMLAAVGLFIAVRRLNLAALVGLCLIPVALALLVAHIALRLSA